MSNRKKFTEEAKKLSRAIDIAIESISKFCPESFNENNKNHFISCYQEWQRNCLNPEPQFRTITSLNFLIQDVFTFFQESSGLAVEHFWKRVKEEDLDYTRENKLVKILKRGRIKNRIEYDYSLDMLVVAEQESLISKAEAKKLSALIGEYELKIKK